MSDVVKWQERAVDVPARLVPRFLWSTASIDVFLGEQRILCTGGQLPFTGSHSATFNHSGSAHTAELSWRASGLSLSFPYQLRIDGVPISAARARIRNWPVGVIVAALLTAALALILHLVMYHEPDKTPRPTPGGAEVCSLRLSSGVVEMRS